MSTWRRGGCGQQPAHLVDLSPLLRRLFCEALVYHGHDFVQQLAAPVSGHMRYFVVDYILVEGPVGDLLHEGRGCTCF